MATDYAGFIATVEREAHVSRDQAERAVTATLETLGERISDGEAHELAEQLPAQLQRLIDRGPRNGPQALSAQQFLWRVGSRAHAPSEEVEQHVVAVFAALREAVSPAEIADLASELPRELEMLLFDDPARHILEDGVPLGPPQSADEFVARVGRRTALDPAAASRATDAVLEVLAFRLSTGETDDLARRLPPGLLAPLERGKAEKASASAHWLPLKQFIMAVAEVEGVGRSEARLHVRAVFQTLAETVGDELADVLSELPSEFRSLLPRAW